MVVQIDLDGIAAEVVLKDIKNIHLRVYPPDGRVRVSAPAWMSLDVIRTFAMSKLGWIRTQQQRFREQKYVPREPPDRDGRYVWGKRYQLKVVKSDRAPTVKLQEGYMLLQVRPGTDKKKREAIVEAWYRQQLKQAVPPLLARWAPRMGVRVERFFVQRMKSRWGSCNLRAHTIRLNTELVKRPPECLEYVVVHELAHLLEPSHNARFRALMDQFMPDWKVYRDQLKQWPVDRR